MTSARVLAILAAAAAVVAAAAAVPHDALRIWRDVRNARAEPAAERRLAPATQVGIEAPEAILRAASVIPPGATYLVVTGDGAALRESRSADYVKFWASFTLLPRRRADRLEQASWVLSYGNALRTLPVRYRRVVDLGDGVRVGEVRR